MATGPQLWTVSGLAAEFGKDNRTVAKRLESVQPVDTVGRTRKWLMRDAAPALLGITAVDPTRERAALDEARRRKIEIDIDRLEARSLDGAVVRDVLTDMIARVRAKLLVLGPNHAARANPDDPARAEQVIVEAIYDALDELADDPFGGVEDVEAAAEADGERVGGRESEAESGVKSGAGKVAH